MPKKFALCLFWGSVWGLSEATAGFLLHLLPVNIGWVVWFPMAFYFIRKVYRETSSLQCLFFTVMIACLIKLVNVFMDPRLDHIINPVASMILESLAFALLYKKETAWHKTVPMVIGVNVAWRIGYSGYMLLMPESFQSLSPLNSGSAMFMFLIIEVMVTSSIITLGIIVSSFRRIPKKSFNPSMAVSIVMMLVAVALQLVV
jgi:hypothetical protein